MKLKPATIVIGSAGRRLYLVDWFREAFDALGLNGRVVVTENDDTSSSASYGDINWPMPKYTDSEYGEQLMKLVDELGPQLFISVNDYELMHLHVHTDLADELRNRGVLLPGVSAAWQRGCADKLLMAKLLKDAGVSTPTTLSGDDPEGIALIAGDSSELVVKHRFGSGSSGLAIVPSHTVMDAVAYSARSAPPRMGKRPTTDDVVVQPKLPGSEYGVDIVGDLIRHGSLAGVLARRKLRMRAGETDKAITANSSPFLHNSELIAQAAGLSGLIDVDMFLDDSGQTSVIDINPRFGGGYPFVHLAGADVPRYYLTRAFGIDDEAGWNEYEVGTVSAKYESVRVTKRQ